MQKNAVQYSDKKQSARCERNRVAAKLIAANFIPRETVVWFHFHKMKPLINAKVIEIAS